MKQPLLWGLALVVMGALGGTWASTVETWLLLQASSLSVLWWCLRLRRGVVLAAFLCLFAAAGLNAATQGASRVSPQAGFNALQARCAPTAIDGVLGTRVRLVVTSVALRRDDRGAVSRSADVELRAIVCAGSMVLLHHPLRAR